jgi:hypothetical protein
LRHSAGSFAGGQQDDAACRWFRQPRWQARRRVCRVYRSAKQVCEKCTPATVRYNHLSHPPQKLFIIGLIQLGSSAVYAGFLEEPILPLLQECGRRPLNARIKRNSTMTEHL